MRQRLPNRRASQIFDFESMSMRFTASISRDADGCIRELFCDNHKAGSAVGTLVRDAAIILSFALQHGADIEAIRPLFDSGRLDDLHDARVYDLTRSQRNRGLRQYSGTSPEARAAG